jgi:hypothetical protein
MTKKKTETLAFQTFRSKVHYLKQHLQVIDASLTYSGLYLSTYSKKANKITNALNILPSNYDTLNHPVSDYLRILNYSKSKNYEFSIIELYNAFSVYMKSILGEMYKHNPLCVVGKATGNPNFSFLELIKLASYEKIEDEMINTVFRRLEDEKSTVKLLDKILKHTNIQLQDPLKTKALMYLEMRHLFIHNNGKADDNFSKTYKEYINITANSKLQRNFNTVNTAIQTVYELVETIDTELLLSKFVSKRI